jgi:cell wall-associated NlpC family hydrolase
MTKYYIPALILFSVNIFLLLPGCTASNNTLRYHGDTEKPKATNTSTRFGSNKENQASQDIIDTSNFDDTSSNSDPDNIPVDRKNFNMSSIVKKFSTKENNKNLTPEQISDREKFLMEIIKYIDTPYKYGGNTNDGIDCSAFTQSVYENSLAIELQRSARDQYQEGDVVEDKEDLQFGDLVFFNTRRGVKPGHVGIYIGDHLFAHSSSRNGVIISSLDEEYYSKRFMGGRRVDNMIGSGTVTNNN